MFIKLNSMMPKNWIFIRHM